MNLIRLNQVRATLGLEPIVITAAGHYIEALHPRGRDGEWIEKYGFVKVLGKGVGEPDKVGQVTQVDHDGAVVKTTDGQVALYPFDRLEHSEVKALIPDRAAGKTVTDAVRTVDPELVDAFGMHVATPQERKALALPPGWKNILIANDKTQPLQVIGLDAAGRPQRRYTAEFTEHNAAVKLERVKRLHEEIAQLDAALEQARMNNDTAAALFLIRRMGMRPGSTTDTKSKVQAYGATTLLAQHVKIQGDTAVFDFIGKDGVKIHLETNDPQVLEVMKKQLAGKQPGDRLFDTNERKVGAFLKQYVDPGFKTKDLRTYLANDLATQMIAGMAVPTTMAEYKRSRLAVARFVSSRLGNTPQMALASYINATVFGPWQEALARTTVQVVASSGKMVYNNIMDTTGTGPPSPMQDWLDATSFDVSFPTLPEEAPEDDDE